MPGVVPPGESVAGRRPTIARRAFHPLKPATTAQLMALDHYAPCPCGSGKKLKFCCSDLAGELEKIMRMLQGDQPRAALAHLDKALAKNPTRTSLIDLKATIEVAIGDFAAAEATVERQLAADPRNLGALAQRAIIAASLGEADGDLPGESPPPSPDDDPALFRAVDALQDALEAVDDTIPARVLRAVGAVGQSLLARGNLVAARSHLWLFQGIAGEEDTRALEMLTQINRVPDLPLLLRDNLFLRELPAGHPAEADYDRAQLLASRGQWRRAAAVLGELVERHPDDALVHYNAAVVFGWLGDTPRFVEGLRRFARAGVAAAGGALTDDAVEAEALAQLLDVRQREPGDEVVRLVYEVADEDRLVERLTRDRRSVRYTLGEAERRGFDGPAPRHTFFLLDRELPETGVGITFDAAPRVLAAVSCFGRQTDRPERLELVTDRDESFAQTIAALAEVAGDGLGPKVEEVALGHSEASSAGVRNWRFPDDTPLAERRAVVAEHRRRTILEDWPGRPLRKLDGKSPLDAKDDPSLRLPLTAAVMVLEQTAALSIDPLVTTELRALLELGAEPPLDPREIDVETVPLTRVGRMDLSQATDDDVYALYKRCELAGAADAVRRIGREAVNRTGLAEDLPPAELYSRLAAIEPDLEDALEWLARGRKLADGGHASDALWDLMELELRVVEGQFDEADRLIRHLAENHAKEEGVAERLFDFLDALGLLPSEEQMLGRSRGPLPEPELIGAATGGPTGGSKLWTPGDEPREGGQKLWTPD